MQSRRRLRGFTLVELVAASACVSLVLSVSLPAMQRARESARATSCRNNLKQLALALHNYHDVYVTFPPGWVLKDAKPTSGPAFAWLTRILPYMDQAQLYNEIEINNPPNLKTHRHYTQAIVHYRCPADDAPDTLKERGGFGTSNYVGNYGAGLIPTESDAEPGSGFFFLNSNIRVRDLLDGTSNTIMVGERGTKTGAAIWSIVRSNAKAEDAVASGNDEKKINSAAGAYSSQHEGGAYFVFVDGAARFISDKIGSSTELDPPQGAFQKLSIRDDGQVITDEELNR